MVVEASDGGDCGEEGGETELEGKRVVCIKYPILYLALNGPERRFRGAVHQSWRILAECGKK